MQYYLFLDNFPPKIINVPGIINVTLRETFTINITAQDSDTVTFQVVNKPDSAMVNQSGNAFLFMWPVTSSREVGLYSQGSFLLFSVLLRDWIRTWELPRVSVTWIYYFYISLSQNPGEPGIIALIFRTIVKQHASVTSRIWYSRADFSLFFRLKMQRPTPGISQYIRPQDEAQPL